VASGHGADAQLLIGHGPDASLRLELDRIDNIDVSMDGRYVAASILGEVVIVDLENHRLATAPIDTTPTDGMNLIGSVTVAANAQKALKINRIIDPFEHRPRLRRVDAELVSLSTPLQCRILHRARL
jgi:hypothetical protein